MHPGKITAILAFLLLAALVFPPALSADITDAVRPAEQNVSKVVTNYTSDLENDAASKLYNYGEQALNTGDYATAITYYDQALAENNTMLKKTDALLYLYRDKAYAQIQLMQFADAVATLDTGITQYPYDAMLWNNKGYALYRLGKPQDALTAYNSATSFDANYTNAYINKGIVLNEMGRYSEAVTAYTRANETDPFNIAASEGLAIARTGEGESTRTMTIVLVIVLIAVIGLVVWYVKIRKPAEPPAPEEKKKKGKSKKK